MSTLAYYLVVPLVAVALVAGHIAFWTWFYRRRRDPDERHYLRTGDGWTVALARLRPAPDGPAGGAPVICCPGVACNVRLFDLDARRSLGRYLARRGFDVWMLELRGTGASERAGFFGRSWAYGFVEYVHEDAAAAVAYVRRVTGRSEVHWVGHSMGGLIGLHLGAGHPEGEAVATLVMIGSPLDFSRHIEHVGPTIWFLEHFLRSWPVVRLARWCRLVAPLAGRLRGFIEPIFQNPRNMAPEVFRHYLVEVVEDVPRRLLNQFADAVFRDRSFDGRPTDVVRRELGTFRRPLLGLSGSWDRVAPPDACTVRDACANSPDCTDLQLGGPGSVDFGHLDLMLGDAAPEVVYPRVADWLLARTSTRDTSSAETAPDARAASSKVSQPV